MYPVAEGLWIGPHLLDVPAEAKRAAIHESGINSVINVWRGRDADLAGAVEAYFYAPLTDGVLDDERMARYDLLARRGVALWGAGGLLVQCHGGRNRSGLLVGLILCYSLGVSGAEALRTVRSTRGASALNNRHFAAWLESLPAASRSARSSASR